MKTFYFSFLLFAGLLFSNEMLAQKVEVLDFHSAHRCKTCLKIENSTKAVLKKEFAKEMKKGKVVFKSIDVDAAKNAKIAEKFEAAGTALWVYRADKKIMVDLTDFAFMNISNQEKFDAKIVEEVRKALK